MVNGIMSESSSSNKSHWTRRGLAGAVAAAAAILLPAITSMAQGSVLPDPDALTLTPATPSHDATASEAAAPASKIDQPFFLDDMAPAAPAPEQPNIHGFANITFTTAYLTPRGLLVVKNGLVIQPIVGLVLPIGDIGPIKNYTLVSGVWNCIGASEPDPGVGGWEEMDFFFSQSGTVADIVNLNLTYGEWNFPRSVAPPSKPIAEQNLDLKISIDDSKWWGDSGFTLNPYVDCWWAISGSSTVVLGRHGGTGYFEIGCVPTYTFKNIMPQYPITAKMLTYISTGPRSYWGTAPENFGVAVTGLSLSVPLSFIPARYGHWHGDIGVTYDFLINGSLVDAGTILTGNTSRNLVEGTIGFGVNF